MHKIFRRKIFNKKKSGILFIVIFLLLGVLLFLGIGTNFRIFANFANESSQIPTAQEVIESIDKIFNAVLFYKIFGKIPFLILWFLTAGVFFTLYIGFPNIRMFTHGFRVAFGKYSSPTDQGQITPKQAVMTAISGTVGLGNIAGVAIAVGFGGPGAVLWMVLMGFLGMSVVFSEAVMSQKYRFIDEKGVVYGGPFRYLRYGLAELGFVKLGRVLTFSFTLFFIIGAIGTPLFQSHELVSSLTSTFSSLKNSGLAISAVLTTFTLIVIIGGITRVAKVTQILVPIMAIIYVFCCLTIIFFNFANLPNAILLMFKDALGFREMGGGFLGAMIAGVKRAAFSNEAGLGTSPIAHATAKSSEPVRQASVACLTPFVDTMIVCFLTGIAITVTGAYNMDGDGVVMTQNAFGTVSDWFPMLLSVSIVLFAVSTILSYGYYGANAWMTMFGRKTKPIYIFLFCLCVFVAGEVAFNTIVSFSESLTLSIAVPNLIGMYLLSRAVKTEFKTYLTKLKTGQFDKIK